MSLEKEYDYIIVGAGSAGCTLANRLSENPNISVLLLEAGPEDRYPMIHMPGGMLEIFKNGSYHWESATTSQQSLGNRQLVLMTGKTLGGSSSVNGMMHIRGSARDFDRWSQEYGCTGWSYQEVLPYFRQTEHNDAGANDQRGGKGELYAASAKEQYATTPLVKAFHKAATDNGIPACEDFCQGDPDGVGWTQAAIRHGKRHSAATAFLNPVKSRGNLKIVTGATVQKVTWNLQGDRPAADGVDVEIKGERSRIGARREVILSAGALRSPQILQLSGIGEKDHLQNLGIEVVAPFSAVGENLHDHPAVKIQYPCSQPITMSGMSMLKQLWIGIQWMLFKKGLGSWNHFDANMFVKSSSELAEADLQVIMVPLIAHGIEKGIGDEHGITFVLCLLDEKSRGSVKVQSTDAADAPLFDIGFLKDRADIEPLLSGIRLCRQLASAESWGGIIGEEILPGAHVSDDQALGEFIRQSVDTDYHYGGTCRMGPVQQESTVVDPSLKVKGVERLRVADASIMPVPLHGNTNACCVMIGAKAADLILSGQ